MRNITYSLEIFSSYCISLGGKNEFTPDMYETYIPSLNEHDTSQKPPGGEEIVLSK